MLTAMVQLSVPKWPVLPVIGIIGFGIDSGNAPTNHRFWGYHEPRRKEVLGSFENEIAVLDVATLVFDETGNNRLVGCTERSRLRFKPCISNEILVGIGNEQIMESENNLSGNSHGGLPNERSSKSRESYETVLFDKRPTVSSTVTSTQDGQRRRIVHAATESDYQRLISYGQGRGIPHWTSKIVHRQAPRVVLQYVRPERSSDSGSVKTMRRNPTILAKKQPGRVLARECCQDPFAPIPDRVATREANY